MPISTYNKNFVDKRSLIGWQQLPTCIIIIIVVVIIIINVIYMAQIRIDAANAPCRLLQAL